MKKTDLLIGFSLFMVVVFGCVPSDPVTDPSSENNTDVGGDSTSIIASIDLQKIGLKAVVKALGIPADANVQVRWDWTNDGTWDTDWSTELSASYTYETAGTYIIKLELKDAEGRTDSSVRTVNITSSNTAPIPFFVCNMVKGMTASVDASSSSDAEDSKDDLVVRWDWNNDGKWDTDWSTTKTAEHTYTVSGSYKIVLQVKDLNGLAPSKVCEVIASPTTIRSCFFTTNVPYMLRINFRLINNLTGLPVSILDTPLLARDNFTIAEDNIPIDLSETGYLLTNVSRPMQMVLILDYTGSMHDAGGIPPMVAAAKAFIDSQQNNTSLGLWAFWERQGGYAEIDDFILCTDAGKAKLKADLDAFTAQSRDQGATEVWDLIKKVIKERFVPADIGTNQAIVFLSDGHDTTSKATPSELIQMANKRGLSLFSVGLAFRPENYPSDEANLVTLAGKTGGTYFTVNQVTDLTAAFDQMAKDLRCDWTLSYITLKSNSSHTFGVDCNYLDGKASIKGLPFEPMKFAGNIRQGLLSVKKGTLSNTQTEYVLTADYIPRNISSLKIRVTSGSTVRLSLYDSNALCTKANGWTISPDVDAGAVPPSDGWYTLTSSTNTPLDFGSFGRIAKCTVDAGNLPDVVFEVPSLDTQAGMYGDKTVIFTKSAGITLRVPTIMTDLTVNAPSGGTQKITIHGRGFCIGDYLVMMVLDSSLEKALTLVKAYSASADGSTMTIEVPSQIQSYKVWVLDDYEGKRILYPSSSP